LGQVELLVSLVQPRSEPGIGEETPEVVARVGEVRTRGRRDPARVDPAENDPQTALEDVRDRARTICSAPARVAAARTSAAHRAASDGAESGGEGACAARSSVRTSSCGQSRLT